MIFILQLFIIWNLPANFTMRAIVPATKKEDQTNALIPEAINNAIRKKVTKKDTKPPEK